MFESENTNVLQLSLASASDTMVRQRLTIYYLNGFVDFYIKQFPDLLQNIHKDLGSKQGLHTTPPQVLAPQARTEVKICYAGSCEAGG